MSSFFTLPASQRKRKRTDVREPRARGRVTKPQPNGGSEAVKRRRRDESISGSSTSGSARGGEDDDEAEEVSGSDSEADEDETGADRRLRLAEQYLEGVKREVQEQQQQAHGFDAEEVDRELIAARLREDAAEAKGQLYRFVAETYDYSRATATQFRCGATDGVTAVAACLPYVYTTSRDRRLIKWRLAEPEHPRRKSKKASSGPPPRRRPIKLLSRRGDADRAGDAAYTDGHTAAILCVAASPDGQFVATGGADKRLIVWSAEKLEPLRAFSQHRDSVTSLALQRGPPNNRLYSASADRTIKTWGLDELAYIETLFGHQDAVVDVAALSSERCVSAGARDRTVRLWKVVEETQLVFRGGSEGKQPKSHHRHPDGGSTENDSPSYAEGSIDRVALIDDETFVSGSDSGALSLWVSHKKKPVYTLSLAHGADPPPRPEEAFAEVDPSTKKVTAPARPRWITALRALPFSDIVVSSSWDGAVRVWRVTPDKKKLEPLGCIAAQDEAGGPKAVNGVVNDLEIIERGVKGRDGLCVVAVFGKEHRLGRWQVKGNAKNGAVVLEIPPAAKRANAT